MQEFESEVEDGDVFALPIDEALAGQRLDVAMTGAARDVGLELSRTRIKGLIEAGHLLLDGRPILDGNRKARTGETFLLIVPPAEDAVPVGEIIPLVIAHEDEHLIVVDKPAGMVVHPAPGHATGTLVNALIAHCGASLSGIGGVRRPGIVHRLDKDTSGLLVVAKSDAAHRGLSRVFADHGRSLPLTRTYQAFVWSKPDRLFGTVDAPVGRHGTDRLRMAVVSEAKGREAITHWRILDSFGPSTLPVASRIACNLETGRTHQIRVHMAHIGHPVMGDPLYAKGFRSKSSLLTPETKTTLSALDRQALHAAVLGFEHPVTKRLLEFESELPSDLLALKDALHAAS